MPALTTAQTDTMQGGTSRNHVASRISTERVAAVIPLPFGQVGLLAFEPPCMEAGTAFVKRFMSLFTTKPANPEEGRLRLKPERKVLGRKTVQQV